MSWMKNRNLLPWTWIVRHIQQSESLGAFSYIACEKCRLDSGVGRHKVKQLSHFRSVLTWNFFHSTVGRAKLQINLLSYTSSIASFRRPSSKQAWNRGTRQALRTCQSVAAGWLITQFKIFHCPLIVLRDNLVILLRSAVTEAIRFFKRPSQQNESSSALQYSSWNVPKCFR